MHSDKCRLARNKAFLWFPDYTSNRPIQQLSSCLLNKIRVLLAASCCLNGVSCAVSPPLSVVLLQDWVFKSYDQCHSDFVLHSKWDFPTRHCQYLQRISGNGTPPLGRQIHTAFAFASIQAIIQQTDQKQFTMLPDLCSGSIRDSHCLLCGRCYQARDWSYRQSNTAGTTLQTTVAVIIP